MVNIGSVTKTCMTWVYIVEKFGSPKKISEIRKSRNRYQKYNY